MKTFFILLFIIASAILPAFAQLSPAITSWKLNKTNATGYSGLPADVQKVQYSSSAAYITASGIPSYTIGPWPMNPNTAGNQNRLYKIPLTPQVQSGTKTATGLGRIAVETNGVAVYNAKDAFSYQNANVWFQNAVVVEAVSFDACLGHPDMSKTYHHHQSPKCGYTFSASQHSPIIGYSFDGYPIYGPYAYTNTNGTGAIKRMVSGYRLRSITTRRTLADGTTLSPNQYGPEVSTQYPLGYYLEDYEFVQGLGDLDTYNGRFAITPEYPQGTYAYYCTIDANGNSAYPYMIGPQYYGVVERSNTGMSQVTITESVTEYTGEAASNPVFTASPSTIAFGTVNVNSSNVRTFTIQGSNFSSNLVITAPTGFSLSITQNGTFAQSIIISPVNNLIQNTTIYVRFLPTQTGAFSGTITQTSGSTALTPIAVSGTAQVPSSVLSVSPVSFSVFPNPASNLLSVQFPSLESPEIILSIFNALGQRLSTAQIQTQQGNFRTELDVSHLNAGMYVLVAERVTERGVKRESTPFLKY